MSPLSTPDTVNTETISKKPRSFLPENLRIDSWESIAPFYLELKERTINSTEELEKWLKDQSELEAVVQEDLGWRYIRMSCDTTDKKASEAYTFFITEIEPKIAPISNDLNKKLLDCHYTEQLPREKYFVYLREIKNHIALFREENIPLFTKLQTEERKYAEITGVMTVTVNEKELTMPQAANLLKENDRKLREEVYRRMSERRLQDRDKLDKLYDTLLPIRHQVALNTGYENYRDYMFASLGRFDYTVNDCFAFHEAIRNEVLPLTESFEKDRKKALKLDKLRPWDLEVDSSGKPPLKPFTTGQELMDKTIRCFDKINTYLGTCMEIMKKISHVDLESRKGKAPGGYNYPLYETGVPFIFMNAAGSLRDVVTMVHEGGHAIHSFLTRNLELTGFKSTPSEVAELASMSMELISMEHWDLFFSDEDELKRAKRQELEKIITILPWIAVVDKFQHWVYTHHGHTVKERTEAWKTIYGEFSGKEVNREGLEEIFDSAWQKQLHLYEVPFYYIEYGMAQLGAIAVWRNYKQNPDKALQNYMNALKLGYTKTIGELYETAGIRFDFSKDYVKELMLFVKEELQKL